MKVLQSVKEEENVVQYKQRKGGRLAGMVTFLRRNCLLKHVIEGNVEGRIQVTERRGRRCKQLLDNLKEKTGYWKLR